jgi:serine/threonine-protein kinase
MEAHEPVAAGDDVSTVVAIPAGAAAQRAAEAGAAPGSSAPTELAMAALRDDEVHGARVMIRVGRAIGLAALIPLPFLGESVPIRIATAVAVGVAIGVGLWVEHVIRVPARYRDSWMVILALSVVPAGACGILYFGIFSAAQLFPVLTLFAFCRRARFATALALYLVVALGELALAAVIVLEWVPDPGLFKPDLPTEILALGHGLIQVGLLAAFVLGWTSHRTSRAAIERMQGAMRVAAQREALLHEARQDLDRALAIGGPGRYTDQTLGGYRLAGVIGRGGMGEVYDAHHVDTGEPAAVKLLAVRELANPRSVERFLREVRAVTALRSPHVVRVLAASAEGDAIPYLVMERLRGQDLAQILREGRLAPDELLELLAQVGAAVEEAWGRGIVHRDLKPQNLFRAEQAPRPPAWKVLDFGVAALADHGGTLTHGHVVGTPAYMAPEQARGERVDHRADLHALAAIAYRCLTGRPVASGPDAHAALYQVVHAMPARPSALASLPVEVDAVLAVGLAKDPAQRFDRVGELRDALAAALDSRLAPALRDRAAAILARHPWSASESARGIRTP